MLLSTQYEVLESLLIKLVFDDERIKRLRVELGDYVSVTYNKDGKRKTIDGYVKRIFLDHRFREHPCHHNEHWSMIVDGSLEGESPGARVEVSKIVDIDMLRKKSETGFISTPLNEDRVTDFRLVGNTLQLSQDSGVTWVTVTDLPVEEPVIDNCDCDLLGKVTDLVPDNLRSDIQKELIEGIIKLVNKESGCECDCHDKPIRPIKPPGCHCRPKPGVIQPISGDFTISNE